MSDPVYWFEYDPRTVSEQAAQDAERMERFAREGGVVVDASGEVVATLTPTDPPTPPPTMRFHVGPPTTDAPIVTT